jgi:hypothetical protein
MTIEDDHLPGELLHETIRHGRVTYETIRYTDLDEPVLHPPPYCDDPILEVHEKLHPQLPSYEDVEDLDDIKDGNNHIREICWGITRIIRIISILLCFYVIFTIIQHSVANVNPNLSHEDEVARPWPPWPKEAPLNFVKRYPVLNDSQSSPECRAAWGALTAVPCPSYILSRNWDDRSESVSPPLISRIVSEICEETCIAALRKAQASLVSTCAGQAAFGIDWDRGRINTKPLESDPSKVVDALVQRTEYTCRKSPIGDAERGFCKVDMSSRWDIVDRYEDDGITELDMFVSATKIYRKELASRIQGLDTPTSVYKSVKEERRYGPRRNSTTCSWCTLNWFENKLAMFDANKIGFGGPESLPQFLRMWEKGGRRCEGNRFNEIFNSAVQSYKNAGLLDEQWESEPSGRIGYLVLHGPSSGDYPLSYAQDIIQRVMRYRKKHGSTALVPTSNPEDERTGSLHDESISCLETFLFEAQELPCYPFIYWEDIKQHVLSSPDIARAACSEACFSAINTLRQKVSDACPSTKLLGMHAYDDVLPKTIDWSTDFSLARWFGDRNDNRTGLMSGYRGACVRTSGPNDIPCGAVFAKWEREEWIYGGRWAKFPDVIRVTQQQLKILPNIPDDLGEWNEPVDIEMTKEEKHKIGQLATWKRTIEDGVCSACMWRTFASNTRNAEILQSVMPKATEDGEEIAMEWIKTMHMLRTECAARRIEFSEQEAADTDAAWIV